MIIIAFEKMKKIRICIYHYLLVILLGMPMAQGLMAQDDDGPEEIQSFADLSPSAIMASPSLLMEVWAEKPVPVEFYSEEEKDLQRLLNQEIDPGVLTYSPLGGYQEWTDIDNDCITPYTWKWVDMELVKDNGSLSKVSLLRPHWWIREAGITSVGDEIWMNIPEMGISGKGVVTEIRVNQLDMRFWHERREGNFVLMPVTGVFEHETDETFSLTFNGMEESLGVTGAHPIRSVDRNDWVSAGELRIGEKVITQTNITILEYQTSNHSEQRVYNLEIYRSHNYLVGSSRILVHNNCDFSQLSDMVIWRIKRGDFKGRPFGGGPGSSPHAPTLAEFNPRIETVRAGDLGEYIPSNPIIDEQLNSVRQLSNEELIKFRMDDPISVSGNQTTGGNHRIYEILNRINEGKLSPDTPIDLLRHD